METNFQNIFYLIMAAVLLLGGVFLLRFVMKFAWKFIRVALIILSVLAIAAYFLGFLNINLP